jgi:phage antirepressor YoqD-like protein
MENRSMTYKVLKATHPTTTEKKIISWMLENNVLIAQTKRVRVVSDSLTAKVRNLTITGYDGRVSYAIIEVP